MTSAEVSEILAILERLYPDAGPQLVYGSEFQLLVAVILSAQCTDMRVNTVTPKLFESYPTPYAMAGADVECVEGIIKPCGFYHAKARAIISCARSIVNDYAGELPRTQEELVRLRGVGRKTANVVYAVAMGGDAIAVDTHVFRVSNRIGLAHADDVTECERQLMTLIPKSSWSRAHHLILFHGRYRCHARRPDCANCQLSIYCEFYKYRSQS